MYTQDLALDNLQGLICHKRKQNQVFFLSFCFVLYSFCGLPKRQNPQSGKFFFPC